MSQSQGILLGGDRGISFPVLPFKAGEDLGAKVKKFRDHRLLNSMTEVFPSAQSFVDHIRSAKSVPDEARVLFVQATFMLEKTMDCFLASGVMTTGTVDASRKMFQEIRFEVQRSLRMLGRGVESVSDPEVEKALTGAKEQMAWLYKMAEQTLGIKRPDIRRAMNARPGAGLELN